MRWTAPTTGIAMFKNAATSCDPLSGLAFLDLDFDTLLVGDGESKLKDAKARLEDLVQRAGSSVSGLVLLSPSGQHWRPCGATRCVGLTACTCYNHQMANATLPRSPFARNIDFHDGAPMRSIAPEELERTLRTHELYVESERRSGTRADLDSTDLAGKSFAGMKLSRIHMRRADLAGADLVGADLRRAILIGAKMQRSRLAEADLTRARLSGINLTDADCKGVCMAETDMEFAILANSDFRSANFRDADMSGAILDAADFSGADLRGANLRGASFQDTRLRGADLREARMGGAFLEQASFYGADLRGAYLRVAKFHRTDLSGADLRDVKGLTAEQIRYTIRDAHTRLPLDLIPEQEDGE